MVASSSNPRNYEKQLMELIEEHENRKLAQGIAQRPRVVGDHLTLGFGYDLATRKNRPATILADLMAAGMELSVTQTAAILFFGGATKEQIWSYLAGSPEETRLFTPSDIAFVLRLGDADRTDDGLRLNLEPLMITQTQGEALLKIILKEKGKELDDFLKKSELPDPELERFHEESDQRAVLLDMYYQSRHLFGACPVGRAQDSRRCGRGPRNRLSQQQGSARHPRR